MQKRYSKEEKEFAILMWKESGLSQTKWCKQEGINRRTFGNWLDKYGSKEGVSSSAGFVAMELDLPKEVSFSGQYEVTYPNGTIVKCPSGISISDLTQLVGLHV